MRKTNKYLNSTILSIWPLVLLLFLGDFLIREPVFVWFV